LKALSRATEEFRAAYRQLRESKVIAPDIMQRLQKVELLLARAAGGPVASHDLALLTQLLGPNLGTEKR